MANARRCDRCKHFYERYLLKDSKLRSDGDGVNGIMLVEITDNQKYYRGPLKDLCPECIETLIAWLEEDV